MAKGRDRVLSDSQRKEHRRASVRKWYKNNPKIALENNKRHYLKYRLDYKHRVKHLWTNARNRAKLKQVPFDLTLEYLIGLYETQAGKCPITKRSFDLTDNETTQFNPNSPSLDRISPKLGYSQGNVRFIVYHLNVALNEYGQLEFEKLIKDYNEQRS